MLQVSLIVGGTHCGFRNFFSDDWDGIRKYIDCAVAGLAGSLRDHKTIHVFVSPENSFDQILREGYVVRGGMLVLTSVDDNTPRYTTTELSEKQAFDLELPPIAD